MKEVLLVDGNSILNRAYFAMAGRQNLTSPDGTPTAAVFSFFNMLFSYVDQLNQPDIVVCFDRKEPTIRHQEYEHYKEGRSPMPDDLAIQFPIVKEGLALMGVLALDKKSYEADDLIGTLAKRAEERGEKVYILSGDRDLWQLISDQITVIFPYSNKKGSEREWMTVEAFEEKYQFLPPQLVDLKALMGDSSDAIPGVAGIGEKGGSDLIREFGTLDAIYEHIDEIKGAKKKRLLEGKESAYLSYKLAKIITDVPLNEEEVKKSDADLEALDSYFTRLGIQKFRDRFDLGESGEQETAELEIEWKSFEIFSDWLDAVNAPAKVSLVRCRDNEFAIADEKKLLYRGDLSELAFIWEVFLEKELYLTVWAGKTFFREFNLRVPDRKIYDCEISAYILNHLSSESKEEEDNYLRAFQAATGRVLAFSDANSKEEKDREAALRTQSLFLMEKEQRELLKEEGLEKLCLEMEQPLALILARMEELGFSVDKEQLDALSKEMLKEQNLLEAQVLESLGTEFNLNSSKQLSEVLFDKLGLPGGKKRKDGSYSTAADQLEKIRHRHPAIPMILEYREVSKLRSTFVEGLRKSIAQDGRIHTTFRQTFTSTGRLSSADPNLQNIPTKSARANEIRRIFVPQDGYLLLDADYSQIELRLLAVMSEDENLLSAFRAGKDIHNTTASQLFVKDPDEINERERGIAKTVNFSIIYGISDFGLAQDLGLTVAEARSYIKAYEASYPKVRPWMLEQVELAKKLGYVETLYGRRRYIPELKSARYHIRQFGERAAMNAPVQGTAADLIKLAMVKTDQGLRDAGLDSRLILQVHDELLIECPQDEVKQAAIILKQSMEEAMDLPIPLKVSLEVGENWNDLREVELD